MRRALALATTVCIAALLPLPATAAPKETTFTVTVSNLTGNRETGPRGTAADGHLGQPLSPPLAVVHTNKVDVWTFGQAANITIERIAEDGDAAVGHNAYNGADGVRASMIVGHPTITPAQNPLEQPIWPGESRTFTVTRSGKFNRLSLATMLAGTNDAFTGLDAVPLRKATYYVDAHDAGTEQNTEQCAHVAQCGNVRVGPVEGGVIHAHPGLVGGAGSVFQPSFWGWSNPVAKITIERAR